MLNWELFTPRNLVMVAIFAMVGIFIYNHFSKKISGQ